MVKIDMVHGVFDVVVNVLNMEATQEYVDSEQRILIMRMTGPGGATEFYGPDGSVLLSFAAGDVLDDKLVNEALDKAYEVEGFGRAAGSAFMATVLSARDAIASMAAEEDEDEDHPQIH